MKWLQTECGIDEVRAEAVANAEIHEKSNHYSKAVLHIRLSHRSQASLFNSFQPQSDPATPMPADHHMSQKVL